MATFKTILFWVLTIGTVAFGLVRMKEVFSSNVAPVAPLPIASAVVATTSSIPESMQSTGTLFSQTSRRAYLIFPTLATGASQALDGFTLTTVSLGNNTYRVTLTPKVSNYKTQTFVLTGDDKLYFTENSYGDDNTSQDYVYGDDYATAVNAQGYILK